MADETKAPPKAAGSSETPAKPAAPLGAEGTSASKPPTTATAKPPASAPKAAVKPEPWSSPLLDRLQKIFPGAVRDAVVFRNQPSLIVSNERLIEVCEFLKSDDGGAYTFLTDETAVDYPKRENRFEINYQLYSFKLNGRLRLKVMAGEGEKVPSVVGVWPGANWLEREVFDMFGVQFEGHPNLKRILLPEDWVGHPLRKDYDILRQDDAWVQANLHIESGQ